MTKRQSREGAVVQGAQRRTRTNKGREVSMSEI